MRERVKWDSTHNPVGLVDMVHAGWVQRLLLAADWSGFPGPEPDLVKNGQTRVGAQAKKIFEKLVDLGIEYVHEPPDSVPGAQWIRPVTEVLGFRQATCVDLCVTFCCAALDAGIYPLIVTLTTANGKQRHSIVVVPLGRTWSTGCDAVIESGFSREPLAVDGCALAGVVAEYADDPTGTWLAIDVQQAMMPKGDWGTALSRGADYLQEWKWDVCVDVGGQRSHKADDAVPPGGNLERILAPARTPLPQDFTPLQLIKARHAVVSFEERSEYRKLRQWATTPARTSTDTANGAGADIAVAVVTGKGGSGKTRMAVELCGDLSSTGWYTGFLRTTTDVTDQELAALEDLATELMVVVDYAEEAQRGRLAEVFRALLVRRAPTRIVLTARGADAWWDEFREEVEQDGLELSNTLVVSNLGKARQEEDQGLLNRIYIRAVRGFSARLYHSIPRSVGLPEDLGDTALDVVLRAWLAVCDEQADKGEEIPTRSDLYDKVLEIEFSQWKKAPVLTKISTNHMRRAAATLSLLAPNQDEDEVDEVLSRLPEWEHEHLRRSRFAELLVHTLLHGDSGDTVSVRPDPVAEYLVLKVFGKKPDLLDQVLPSDPLEVPGIEDPDSDESVVQRALLLGQQSQNVCVALTRAAFLDPTGARRLAGRALKARPNLWSCVLDVALIQGGPFAPALEGVIASGADLPLAEIENAIPLGHGALRGVALAATRRLADFAERNPEQQARWANSLSVRLSAVGDREGALGAAREAVGLYRALAEAAPAAYRPDLAGSLNNLASFLSAVGDREGALGAAREAVGVYRALAKEFPAAHTPNLAGSLNNLANCLSAVGDREGALGAAREAVGVYRALAKEFPAAHTPDLAMSLKNLANRLSAVGDREGALGAAREAVGLYRALAKEFPAAHTPNLAGSLNNLAGFLSAVGDRDEALEAAREAVGVYRGLAEAAPRAYMPDLAGSLNNLANCLSAVGESGEALGAAREAVGVYRALAKEFPAAHTPNLAGSLNNLAGFLSAVGDREGALEAVREAVRLRRGLAEMSPAAHTPNLAGSLNNLANILLEAGDREGALGAAREAVGVYRGLAEAAPRVYMPDLAGSLNNLAGLLSEVGNRDEALGAAREAVDLYRALAKEFPAAHTPNLAGSLNNLASFLSAVGDRDEALEAAREAVGVYRALAEDAPAAHTPDLAMSLNNLANRLSAVGESGEALGAAREAVGVYRGLAEAAPRAYYMPDLAMSLNTLAIRLSDVGERCKALGAAREAVGLYRALAEAAPAAYRPDLAGSLNNLASFLSDVGDREGALGAAREAVDLYRALAKEFPAAHTPDLAISLNNLASFLSAVGDREGALGAVREAVRLRRGLAVKYPAPHTPDLAASLRTLAALLSETGQREEALAVFIEDFDRFPPATRAYLLLARAAWRNNNEDEDLTAAAHEADAADAPAFLGPVRRMIAHAIADSGKDLEGLPPWATVTVDPTMRSRLNAWLNCSDRSEQADLVETTWSSPSDSERAALSAAAELYVDVPLLRELAALVDRVAKDGLEAVVTRLRCLYRSQVLAEDWYKAHMNGRGAQYLHEHMMRGSDAPQRDSGSDEGSREEPKEWEKGLYDPSVRAEVLQVLAFGLPEAAADEMRRILALTELSDPGTAYAARTSDEGAEDALKEFLEARNWRAMVAILEVRPGMEDSPYGRVAAVLAAAARDDPDGRMRELMDYASEKLDAVDRRLVEALVDVALRTKDCPPAFADLRDWFK